MVIKIILFSVCVFVFVALLNCVKERKTFIFCQSSLLLGIYLNQFFFSLCSFYPSVFRLLLLSHCISCREHHITSNPTVVRMHILFTFQRDDCSAYDLLSRCRFSYRQFSKHTKIESKRAERKRTAHEFEINNGTAY